MGEGNPLDSFPRYMGRGSHEQESERKGGIKK